MAWRNCGNDFRRFQPQIFAAQSFAPLMSSPVVSSIYQSGAFGSRHQGQRFLHHRLQSAWDVAKSNVARVPSLVSSRPRTQMSFCRKFTSVVLLGLTGVAGASIYDDYLIFEQCSKRAMERATSNRQLQGFLGEHIQQGPWYEATMGVDHDGHSASCSFPVTGSLGTANLHLRAVRYEGRNSSAILSFVIWPGSGKWDLLVLEALIPSEQRSWLTSYLPGMAGGQWEVLVLEALVPSMISRGETRVNLLQPVEGQKVGDRGGGGPCGPPNTAGHHEV